MHRRRLLVAIGAAALVTVGMLPLPAMAAGPDRAPTRIDLGKIDPSFRPMSAQPDRQVTVMLQLRGLPAVRIGTTRADQRTAARDISRSQQDAAAAVRQAGGKVLASYQYTYNGLRVRATVSDLGKLAALPQVVAVRPLRTYTIDNANGNTAIGASTAWTDSGATGDGVIVAVIDSGIDYTHADFGGAGTADAYDANDPAVVEPGSFPTPKVIAGYDFAGNDYDASSTDEALYTPNPDGDPLDCGGHGSHVSGTIAGAGVNLDGSTYSGRYTSDTVGDGSDFVVSPGIAPEAKLVALKVFGCEGSTDLVVDALEWVGEYNANHAVGIDVVNMSLGSPFGVSTDPDAVASNSLVSSGVVVVASAGNESDVPYITGAPAVATQSISVAAYDAFPTLPMAAIETTGDDVPAINMNGASLPVDGPLKVLTDGPSDLLLGCDAADFAGVSTGDIVVVKRGVCAFVDKGKNAQDAGAAAIIVINRDDTGEDELPPYIGFDPSYFTIPMLGTANNVAGSPDVVMDDVFIALDGTDATIVDNGTAPSPTYTEIADFSSAGPRWGDSALKPDVAAPGVSVLSVAVGTGTDGANFSGTSMAAPMTAGAAALVIQGHRTWSPLEIKAALVNTADPSLVTGYTPLRSGSGLIQVDKAASANAVATTSDGTATLSWGYRQLADTWTSSKYITITNDGPTKAIYALSSSSNKITPAVSQVTVKAHSSATVKVTAKLSRSAVKNLCSPDQWVAEACDGLYTLTGAVTASPVSAKAGQYSLRVPFIVAPRGMSKITSTTSSTWKKSAGKISGKLLFANTSYYGGNADVYALGPTDAKGDGTHGTDVRATGMQVLSPYFLWDEADSTDRSLVFAINLNDRFSSASPHEFDIEIDLNGDQQADYILFGYDAGLVFSGAFDGLYAAFVYDLGGNAIVDAWLADAPLNGSTVLLPALASDFGLYGGGELAYRAVAWNGFDGTYDETGWSKIVDPWAMLQSQGQFKAVDGKDTAKTGAWFYRVPSVKGWLVVSMDDQNGYRQADIVKVPKKP
jgi:minor extracellular serine protease Vpr